MKRTSRATIVAGLLSAIGLISVQQAHAEETCPLSLTAFGELSPGQVQRGDTRFGLRDVDFTAFVGNASSDLVGTDVTSVTFNTRFAIESAPECTGRPSVEGSIIGDSRFDDVIRFCGVLSVPESLIGAIGVVGTLVGEETCIP